MSRVVAAIAVIFAMLVAGPTFAAPLSWNGFYAGAYGGAAQKFETWDIYGVQQTGTQSGGMAGAQVGFNWTSPGLLAGVQADLAWTKLNGTVGNPNSPVPGNCWAYSDQTARCGTNLDWIGDISARIGVFTMPDTLVYLKGGIAYSHSTFTVDNITGGGGCYIPGPPYAPVSQTRKGMMAGIGAERAFTPMITGFAEYDIYDFGTKAVDFLDTGNYCTHAFTANVSQILQAVKFGVHFHL